MKLSHPWSKATPLFDDERLVSDAGLVPVMALAEQTGFSDLVNQKVNLASLAPRVASAGVNPAGKLPSIIAGMVAGADSIDDLQVVRSGGMKRVFDQVYAPATLGQFLREFTHGHCQQLASVARAHLVNLTQRTDLLPGIETQAYVDIDSLLRPVFGHAKQGASFGHAKVAGRVLLRRGLSPLATTISTPEAAPVLAGIRLRAGRAGSGVARVQRVVGPAFPLSSVDDSTLWRSPGMGRVALQLQTQYRRAWADIAVDDLADAITNASGCAQQDGSVGEASGQLTPGRISEAVALWIAQSANGEPTFLNYRPEAAPIARDLSRRSPAEVRSMLKRVLPTIRQCQASRATLW